MSTLNTATVTVGEFGSVLWPGEAFPQLSLGLSLSVSVSVSLFDFIINCTLRDFTMIKHKLVFLGDQSVGKTSLLSRFMYDKFDNQYKATVGIDFMSKTMYLPDRTIRLQLWDTAGQERFRTLVPSYIRDSNVAVVVYDITDANSFEAATKWIDDVQAERQDQALIVLVGNKCDLSDKRVISQEEGKEKARQYGAIFQETSAKAGINVKTLFKKIATELAGSEIPQNAVKDQQTEVVDVSVAPNQEQGSCAC